MYGLTTFRRAYDPFKELREMQKAFSNEELEIKTDVRDTGDSYILDAELPGYTRDEISVDVQDDILTVKAEKKSEEKETDKKTGYIRCERYYGSASRSFNISEVDVTGITAKHENGVLTLTLPKKKEQIPQSKKIEIL